MIQLSEYTVESATPLFFSDEFLDTSAFREWLLKKSTDFEQQQEKDSEEFQLVYSIVQKMSQIRYKAEEYYSENHQYLVKDKRKALPLHPEKILDILTSSKKAEPPETVISRIAQNKIHIVSAVINGVRKILRRERELSPLSRVQQIDGRCLSWLTRQPGYTPAQKAGVKQKILSVVRKESFDTLENRVLKAFLKLCVAYGQRYLFEFRKQFPGNPRITAVQRLCNLSRQALEYEEIKSVSLLQGVPVPNYVLMHDKYYSVIWQMYLDLIHQTYLMENAWRNRPALLKQYCLLHLILAIRLEYQDQLTGFSSVYCFESGIQKDKLFIQNTSFQETFLPQPNRLWQFISTKNKTRLISGDNQISIPLSFGFIPKEYWGESLFFPENKDHFYCFFSNLRNKELPENICCFSHESEIFDTMLNCLHKMLWGKQ